MQFELVTLDGIPQPAQETGARPHPSSTPAVELIIVRAQALCFVHRGIRVLQQDLCLGASPGKWRYRCSTKYESPDVDDDGTRSFFKIFSAQTAVSLHAPLPTARSRTRAAERHTVSDARTHSTSRSATACNSDRPPCAQRIIDIFEPVEIEI